MGTRRHSQDPTILPEIVPEAYTTFSLPRQLPPPSAHAAGHFRLHALQERVTSFPWSCSRKSAEAGELASGSTGSPCPTTSSVSPGRGKGRAGHWLACPPGAQSSPHLKDWCSGLKPCRPLEFHGAVGVKDSLHTSK